MKLEYNKPPPTGYNAAMARSLSDFLETLAGERELVRIGTEVDPGEELAEIVRRAAETGSPALLFDRVRGSKLPRVANLLATPARACRALGIGRLEELALRTESLLRQSTAQGWLDRLRSAPDTSAERLRPKTVRSGAVQQIVRLPARHRPGGAGPGPLVARRNRPVDQRGAARGDRFGRHSSAEPGAAGPHRSGAARRCPREAENARAAGPQLAIVDDGAGDWTRLWQAARAAGERLPVAAILGGDPAWRIAAATPLAATLAGGGLDAYEWLAAVCGAALEVVRCRTQPLEVPAEADLVIEGYLDPAAATVPITLAAAAGPYYRRAAGCPAASGRSDHRTLRLLVADRRGRNRRWRVGRATQGERAIAAAAGQSRDCRTGRLLAAGRRRRRPLCLSVRSQDAFRWAPGGRQVRCGACRHWRP